MAAPTADNNRTPWYQLVTEAELGTPRTYVGGLTLLQTLTEPRELGGRFFTQDTQAQWEIVEIPAGTPVAVLTKDPGPGFAFGLPPPRVRIFNATQVVSGFDRQGNQLTGIGQIAVSLEDVPNELLTNPAYRFQLELLRYMPKRSKRTPAGRRPQPQGFYHPSNWINGANPTPQVAGTRYGSQNFPASATVNRQTEWPLAGMAQMSRVLFNVADVFLPWYQRATINDSAGGSVESLLYFLGVKRNSSSGVWSYRRNPFLGVFKFRYAAYDSVNTRFVVGPYSEPVFTRPKKWPTKPTGAYPDTRVVNTDPVQEDLLVLVAGVGGRVNSKVPA